MKYLHPEEFCNMPTQKPKGSDHNLIAEIKAPCCCHASIIIHKELLLKIEQLANHLIY